MISDLGVCSSRVSDSQGAIQCLLSEGFILKILKFAKFDLEWTLVLLDSGWHFKTSDRSILLIRTCV